MMDEENKTMRPSALVTSYTDAQSLFSVPSTNSNLFLPKSVSVQDADDIPMNQVFHDIEHYEQDLFWSFFSDTCFVVGGILSVVIAVWEYQDRVGTLVYYAIDILGPLVYFYNSIVDVQWALHVGRRRKKRKHALVDLYEENSSDSFPQLASSSSMEEAGRCPNFESVRKYSAHRRTILAASTFGIAALCAVIAIFFDYGEEQQNGTSSNMDIVASQKTLGEIFDRVSEHVYVLSAVISVTGKRVRPWLYAPTFWRIFSTPECLEDLGDLLFLIGSLLDAVVGDFDLHTPFLSLWSTGLWLLDACFYLRSDIISARLLREKEENSEQALA